MAPAPLQVCCALNKALLTGAQRCH